MPSANIEKEYRYYVQNIFQGHKISYLFEFFFLQMDNMKTCLLSFMNNELILATGPHQKQSPHPRFMISCSLYLFLILIISSHKYKHNFLTQDLIEEKGVKVAGFDSSKALSIN